MPRTLPADLLQAGVGEISSFGDADEEIAVDS